MEKRFKNLVLTFDNNEYKKCSRYFLFYYNFEGKQEETAIKIYFFSECIISSLNLFRSKSQKSSETLNSRQIY